jgi:hypothetical protein
MPSVSSERLAQPLVRVAHRLEPAPPAAERLLHPRLGGPRADERHRGDRVGERSCPQHAQQVAHRGRLELEAVERVAGRDRRGGDGVVGRDRVRIGRARASVQHSPIVVMARFPSRSIFTSPIASTARISNCDTTTPFAARSSGR